MPDVSVLMTVFNGAPYLKEAIESILGQTFKDFEFIVVDNASTDSSLSILKEFKDHRIKLISNDINRGQTKALNLALSHAKGTYIARMDADDVSLPHRLMKQVAFLKNHPKAAVVGAWHEEIDTKGQLIKVMKYPTNPHFIQCHLLSDGNLTRRCFAHPTALFLKKALLEVGGYNNQIKFAQDYELWTRIVQRYEIHNIGDVLLKYRVNPSSSSKRNREEMTQELDSIVSMNIRRLWPELQSEKQNFLRSMLRNQTFYGSLPANELHVLFDELFEKATLSSGPSKNYFEQQREKIKFYYLPRMFKKSPLYASSYLMKTLVHWPLWLFDSKFHKNVVKLALN